MSINYLSSISPEDLKSKYPSIKKNKDKSKSITFSDKQSFVNKVWERIKTFFGHSTLEKVAKLISAQLKENPTLTASEQRTVKTLHEKINKFNSSIWHLKVNAETTGSIENAAKSIIGKPSSEETAPTILQTPTKLRLKCMGISNTQPNGKTYNRCCLNSTLKLLWATPGFREELTKENRKDKQIAQILLKLLNKFDENSVGEMSQENDPDLRNLVQILQESLPGMKKYQQQDAHEIFNIILRELTKDDPRGTPAFLCFREQTTRKETSPAIKITTIDEKQPDQTYIYTVPIPEDTTSWNLAGDFTTGTNRSQTIEQNDVTLRNKDKTKVTPEQFSSVHDQLGQEVHYHSRILIENSPPKHLFLQLNRFLSTDKEKEKRIDPEIRDLLGPEQLKEMIKEMQSLKNTSKIPVPFTFNAHSENKDAQPLVYQLKAVVIHDGEFTNSGHYYTFVPDPTSPRNSEGMPTKWIEHNDGIVREATLDQIGDKLEHHAYLFSYALIS